jgi:protein tyrosine phosphatase
VHLTAHFVIVLTKCRIFLLIHFSDGAGRTGTYIAISNLLERMKIEHAMDVFQAIKIIRGIRPQFVENAVSIYSFPRPVNEMNCMRK